MKNNKWCVYKHTSPSKGVYIGITKQNPVIRWSNGSGYKRNPYFYKAIQKYGWDNFKHEILFSNLTQEEAEKSYLRLLDEGWTPQQARSILPNSLKTELVMTGTIEQWKGFFKLRSSLYGAIGAHPQAAELADKLYIQFKEKNYI